MRWCGKERTPLPLEERLDVGRRGNEGIGGAERKGPFGDVPAEKGDAVWAGQKERCVMQGWG